jgi:hypothetical protein
MKILSVPTDHSQSKTEVQYPGLNVWNVLVAVAQLDVTMLCELFQRDWLMLRPALIQKN